MSQTSCWVTNRLSQRVKVHFGYGSQYDMLGGPHGIEVSLDGLRVMARCDYTWITERTWPIDRPFDMQIMQAYRHHDDFAYIFDGVEDGMRRLNSDAISTWRDIARWGSPYLSMMTSPVHIYHPDGIETSLAWYRMALEANSEPPSPRQSAADLKRVVDMCPAYKEAIQNLFHRHHESIRKKPPRHAWCASDVDGISFRELIDDIGNDIDRYQDAIRTRRLGIMHQCMSALGADVRPHVSCEP